MSFNIGLSGLRTTNQSLDVISQNIANVSTAGFKASRPELAALYSGGQAGGVEMSNVSQNFSKDGSKQNSGRALDMAISGQGFFQVKDQNGQNRYTRAGMFNKDADNFITTSNGMRLQGYAANAEGILNTGVITDLAVNATNLPANASTSLEFTANFKADAPTIDTAANPFDPADAASYNFSYSSGVFDSLGNEHTLTQYFVKESDNTWRSHFYMDGAAMAAPADQAITFNTDGTLATPNPATVALTHAPAGADPMAVTLDLRGSTQYSGEFSVTRNATDGYTAGEMTGLRVDDDGTVSAVYNNGRTRVQGQVVLANFTNPNGLAQADSTTWTETFASGQALTGVAGTGALGTLTPGAYEDSNVDLTGELVNLMTAQRNYQANAKSVSTADQLTQVLFNNM
jgi:flagellar hook protein FlgE